MEFRFCCKDIVRAYVNVGNYDGQSGIASSQVAPWFISLFVDRGADTDHDSRLVIQMID